MCDYDVDELIDLTVSWNILWRCQPWLYIAHAFTHPAKIMKMWNFLEQSSLEIMPTNLLIRGCTIGELDENKKQNTKIQTTHTVICYLIILLVILLHLTIVSKSRRKLRKSKEFCIIFDTLWVRLKLESKQSFSSNANYCGVF